VLSESLNADGVIVCSAAGSTAYNASAGGAIMPLDARIMGLTAICPAIFERWRSVVLPISSVVTLEALETDYRPVRFLVDGNRMDCIVDGVPVDCVHKAIVSASDSYAELLFGESLDYRQKALDAQLNRR
jgi:NAD kinase